MIKHKLALTLAIVGLVSMTAVVAADPVLDTWQPGVYFKADFGGQPKKNDYHFGAHLALSEQAVNKIYGGNVLMQAQRALRGEKPGELPDYLKFDFNSSKDFTAQWMGTDVYRYDYVTQEATSPMMLNFGPFNTADSWAIIVTGSMIGAAGLGYGISQWTSSTPPSGGTALLANGLACVAGAECASGFCCGGLCAAICL